MNEEPHFPAALTRRYGQPTLIGRGGMASVWAGQCRETGCSVAIKVMDKAIVDDQVFRQRFDREASLARREIHPALVRIVATGEIAGQPYVVMERVFGSSLRALLDEQGAMAVEQVFEWGRQLAECLGALHDIGIVHRDVKPDNVMVDEAGQVRLLDLGVARLIADDGPTKTGLILGSLWYLAPENILGVKAQPATDVYALGLLQRQPPAERQLAVQQRSSVQRRLAVESEKGAGQQQSSVSARQPSKSRRWLLLMTLLICMIVATDGLVSRYWTRLASSQRRDSAAVAERLRQENFAGAVAQLHRAPTRANRQHLMSLPRPRQREKALIILLEASRPTSGRREHIFDGTRASLDAYGELFLAFVECACSLRQVERDELWRLCYDQCRGYINNVRHCEQDLIETKQEELVDGPITMARAVALLDKHNLPVLTSLRRRYLALVAEYEADSLPLVFELTVCRLMTMTGLPEEARPRLERVMASLPRDDLHWRAACLHELSVVAEMLDQYDFSCALTEQALELERKWPCSSKELTGGHEWLARVHLNRLRIVLRFQHLGRMERGSFDRLHGELRRHYGPGAQRDYLDSWAGGQQQ